MSLMTLPILKFILLQLVGRPALLVRASFLSCSASSCLRMPLATNLSEQRIRGNLGRRRCGQRQARRRPGHYSR